MRRFTLVVALMTLSSPAAALPITYAGTFDATDPTPAAGVSASISGTWRSVPFEFPVAPPVGTFNFAVHLAELSFNPSPYSPGFSFDPSNSKVYLSFQSGTFYGTSVVGPDIGLLTNTDDFVVSYSSAAYAYARSAAWTASGSSGENSALIPDVTGYLYSVPEPAALPWLAFAALGLLRRQSLRR